MTAVKEIDGRTQFASLGILIRVASARLTPLIEDALREHDLTLSEWTTLMALKESDGVIAGKLARTASYDAGSLTRLVDEMIRRGLVRRKYHQDDRRLVTVHLTAQGRTLVRSLTPKVVDFWNGLLSGFAQREVDTLIALLTRLAAATESITRR